jgi:ABC-type nitrate/sulfonate/bicarbonate transport system substrate-binding protein
MGSLPQESKLLLEFEGKYVKVAGQDVLGPAALWFSSTGAMVKWLDANPETVMKLHAVWYRAMRALREMPDVAYPMFTELINTRVQSAFTPDQVKLITTDLETYYTYQEAKDRAYNPSSSEYWRLMADFYAKLNVGGWVPANFVVDDSYYEEKYFNEFMTRQDLLGCVDSPLE